MAIPNTRWNHWGASTIQPRMRAIVHFPSGAKVYDSDYISDVRFSINAFDSTQTLFGKPVVNTGSISFVDYDQTLNPTVNDELTEGIEVDLFIGLVGYYDDDQLGPNIVDRQEENVQVTYRGDTMWAIPFWTTVAPELSVRYRLAFDFEMPDGSIGQTEQIGTVEELFVVPDNWPDYTHLAIVYPENMTVTNLTLQKVTEYWDPYGVFYTQEWSYSSDGGSADVDLVCGMNNLLQLDNRASAAVPTTNASPVDFLKQLIELSGDTLDTSDFVSPVDSIPFCFYESTQSGTISDLVESLAASLVFLPDGTMALYSYNGYYNTNITLTDDDIDTYDIQQTSSITMDSASVEALLPTNVESSELARYSNILLDPGDIVPLSAENIMSVDYATAVNAEDGLLRYSSDITSVIYESDKATTFDTLVVYGHAVTTNAIAIFNVQGALPYTITSNPYIQSINQAQALVDALDSFIDLKYRVLSITLRGCPGFWPGATITINSAKYGINAKYVIIGIDFSYNGAVYTTLTLQRYVG